MEFFLIFFGGWIYFNEVFSVHSRFSHPYETTYTGKETVKWAMFFLSFGIALFAPIFKSVKILTLWISFWLILSLILVLPYKIFF